jgi:hypothetical protein
MSLRDILVGIDASTAGERLLRSALGLAREHKACLAAAYCMAEDHAAVVLARAPVNPSPGIFVAPEALTASGDPAADPFPQNSQEAQIADRVQHLFFGMNCSGKASMASDTCSPATQSVFSIWQSRSI